MAAKKEIESFPIGLLVSGLGALLIVGLVVGFWVYIIPPAGRYPGSSEMTSQEAVSLVPKFYMRQVKVYLTQDHFPTVTRWYGNEFGLLPFWHGQDNCVQLRSKTTRILVITVMQVTICDTINGRMIHEERSVQIK